MKQFTKVGSTNVNSELMRRFLLDISDPFSLLYLQISLSISPTAAAHPAIATASAGWELAARCLALKAAGRTAEKTINVTTTGMNLDIVDKPSLYLFLYSTHFLGKK